MKSYVCTAKPTAFERVVGTDAPLSRPLRAQCPCRCTRAATSTRRYWSSSSGLMSGPTTSPCRHHTAIVIITRRTVPRRAELDAFPTFPHQNNIFSHDGWPGLDAFSCDAADVTGATGTSDASCVFTVLQDQNLKGTICWNSMFNIVKLLALERGETSVLGRMLHSFSFRRIRDSTAPPSAVVFRGRCLRLEATDGDILESSPVVALHGGFTKCCVAYDTRHRTFSATRLQSGSFECK